MNNKANKKKIYIAIGMVLLVLLLVIVIYKLSGMQEADEDNYRTNLGSGIVIQSVSQYSGDFVEDGSDREVKNVWSLTVNNMSDQDIQYLRIKAEHGEDAAYFDITTLTAGSTVQVLESSAAEYPDWENDCVYSIENLALFNKERSLYSDLFTVSARDGWIKVENKGTEDITNDIYVYYKNVEDGEFLGGITYRLKFDGGIPAGETREEQSTHYKSDISQIMYLTYE